MSATQIAIVIIVIVLLSFWRLAQSKTAGLVQQRIILVVLGVISAVCLYFTLQPPAIVVPAAERVLETANADKVADKPASTALALPEAKASTALRIPDLATVLRQQPAIQQLHIVGDGLPERDYEAARRIKLQFTASPVPNGLIDFWQTHTITEGAIWSVRGRVNGHTNATLEWLNPAGVVQTRLRLPNSGEFAFNQTAGVPGRVLYQLRLRANNGATLESMTVPVWIQPARTLSVQSVAGAPNAELKTLRRWILDSGQTLRSRVEMAPDFAMEGMPVDLSPAGLQKSDVLVLDERAWQSLNAGQRRGIQEAVNLGLGFILRITGPLSSSMRADFLQMGIPIEPIEMAQSIKLDSGVDAIELSRQPVQVRASPSQVLLREAQGQPLAVSKSRGQGRIAVLWLTNSYRLALAGNMSGYGQLWSTLFSAVARPHSQSGPMLPNGPYWLNQRVVICHLEDRAAVTFDQERIILLPQAVGPIPGCAGFWPQTTGWQQLQSGTHRQWFYVHGPEQGQALQRQQTRVATQALVSNQVVARNTRTEPMPGSPWPWFAGWLMSGGLLWWRERRALAKVP